MYGTVARVKVKPGKLEDLQALNAEWDRDFRPNVDGVVASYFYQMDNDPNELFLVAVFRDKAAYTANADSPEQDKWYRRFRECLDADPEWNDGEVIYSG